MKSNEMQQKLSEVRELINSVEARADRMQRRTDDLADQVDELIADIQKSMKFMLFVTISLFAVTTVSVLLSVLHR